MLGPKMHDGVRKPQGMCAGTPWRPYRRYRSSWYIAVYDHPHPAPQFSDPYVVFGPAIYPVCVDSERTSLTPTNTVISDYQWNLKTMTFNRYKSTSTHAYDNKQVGAVLFSDGSDTKFAVCFAVSSLAPFIEIIHRRDHCLESICKGLDAATSRQYSGYRRSHYAQHACGTANVHVQAILNSEMVMGEEVWVIDLTLAPKGTPSPMDRREYGVVEEACGEAYGDAYGEAYRSIKATQRQERW
jgi:hypothetical protein